MRIKLRVKKFFIGICLALFMASVSLTVYGQIKLKGNQTTDIIFSISGETESDYIKQVNPSNSEIFKGSINIGEVYPFKSRRSVESGLQSPFYTLEQFNDLISLGFETSTEQDGTFATFSFQNDADLPIGELNLAFDWIIHSDRPPELKLQYRVNDAGWNDAHEGYFNSPAITTEDEFISVSTQYSLDQIYIKKGDKIDIRWLWRTDKKSSFFALQSIEVKPEVIEKQDKLYPGSLIITEILPAAETTEGVVEYFEVYNSTDQLISLKGVEIWINGKYEVIQEDVHIKAHEFLVFSTSKNESFFLNSSYSYSSLSINKNGGSIKLVSDSVDLSKATYDAAYSNRSWELKNTGDAYDGYASMEAFLASESSINSELKGSPGREGSTIRMFSKIFETPGWHFIGIPGIAAPDLNRNFPGSVLIKDFDSDRASSWIQTSLTDLSPGNAALIQVEPENSNLYKLMATEIPSVHSIKIGTGTEEKIRVAGNPFPAPITLKHIVNPQGIPAVSVVQIWNSEDKSFRLVNQLEDEIQQWRGFILPELSGNNIEIREKPVQYQTPNTPTIHFEFTLQSGDKVRYDDYATALKLIQDEKTDIRQYQMSKFLPFRNNEEDPYRAALIYIDDNSGRGGPAAQAAQVLNGSGEITFFLTPMIIKESGMATLNWSFDEWLPDQWEITLTDLKTGIEIDMREEELFQFQVAESLIRKEILPSGPGLYPVPDVDLESRIKIKINPESAAFDAADETESEKPDAVALNQNYPNPFNPTTNIEFYLPEQQSVKIEIFNVVGQRVAVLVENVLQAGEHSVVWDASEMPSGIYIIQMAAGNRVLTRKITLVK